VSEESPVLGTGQAGSGGSRAGRKPVTPAAGLGLYISPPQAS